MEQQLMALKMSNHELAQENRRMRGDAPTATDAAMADAAAMADSALALGRSFAHGASAAVSSLSQKGRAGSLMSSLTGKRRDDEERMVEEEAELEAVRAEVVAWREHFGTAQENLQRARARAMDAQQVAAAAAAATEASASARVAPEAVRRAFAELSGDAELPAVLSDEALLHIALVVLELVDAANASGASSPQSPPPPPDPGDSLQPLLKIQEQQKNLERLRDAVEKQEAQIARLSASVNRQREKNNNAIQDGRNLLEGQLRSAELQRLELEKRIEASEGVSRQTYELRCHFTNINERLAQQDQLIERLLHEQHRLDDLQGLFRERLRMSGEDLLSELLRGPRGEPGGGPGPTPSSDPPAAPPPEVHAQEAGDASSATSPQRSGRRCSEGSPSPARSSSLGLEVEVRAEAGVQAESPEPAGADEESRMLQSDVEAARARLQEFQQSSAREAQELRALARHVQRRLSAGSEEIAEARPAPGADPPEEPGEAAEEPAGEQASSILYVQKIQELEALSGGLERDLDLLGSTVSCLVADSREKEELVAFLMRKAASEPAAATDEWGSWLDSWWGGRQDPQVAELGRNAEEAMLDNMRLKNDLRTLAVELQKVVHA